MRCLTFKILNRCVSRIESISGLPTRWAVWRLRLVAVAAGHA